MIDRGGTAYVVLQVVIQLRKKLFVQHVALIRQAKLLYGLHERFSDKHAAVRAEVATRIRQIVGLSRGLNGSQSRIPR